MEPLNPPKGSAPGDKVFIEGYNTGEPDAQLNPKKKVWDKIQVSQKVLGKIIVSFYKYLAVNHSIFSLIL